MLDWLIILSALFGLDGPDGAAEGRAGNELFREGQYTGAVTTYRQGLARMTAEPGPIRAGLYNNLGAAQYQLENYADATQAFNEGLAAATTQADKARLAYNAGNSSFREQELEKALERYRQALLTNPDHENAKFNYEFVKRRLENQREQQSQNSQDDNEQQDEQNESREDRQQGEQNEEDEQQQNQQQQENQQENQQEQQNSQQNQQDQQDQQQNNSGTSSSSDEESSQTGQQQRGEREQQLSRQEAMRILQALQNSEENLLRQGPTRSEPQDREVDKDW